MSQQQRTALQLIAERVSRGVKHFIGESTDHRPSGDRTIVTIVSHYHTILASFALIAGRWVRAA